MSTINDIQVNSNLAGTAKPPSKKRLFRKHSKKLFLYGAFVLVLAASIITAAYYIHRYDNSQREIKRLSAASSENSTQQLVNQVTKLTVLPAGETPTVFLVNDISKLKGQAFFDNAQNGDKVLIYTQAKKAYLYRPSTNQLINIAPLNLGNSSNATSSP